MTSRRKFAVITVFASILLLSVSFIHFEGFRPTKASLSLSTSNPVPLENHFPSEEQKILHGASNVWQDDVLTDEPRWQKTPAIQDVSNDVFILLKTGAETMWSRIPIHFNTTMKMFPHNAIYSDLGGLLDNHVVWDVLQYLPSWLLNSDSLLGYRIRRTSIDDHWGWGPVKLKIEGDGAGWQIDRFKNIPAFLHAWEMTNGEMPWYFMIDGDTYVLTSTVTAITKDHDPDETWYFGHGVGANPLFAHGGSGIMLSRGAMRAMFHEPHDIEWHKNVIEEFSKRAQENCCGDSVVAVEFERLTGIPADTNLEKVHHGLFQGNSISSLRLHPDMWCSPIGTFHHITTAEMQTLFDWEKLTMARKVKNADLEPLSYADFYEDFVEPFLVDQRPGWYFNAGHDETMASVFTPDSNSEFWDGDVKLDPVGVQADCRRTCVLNETCVAWEWHKNIKCRIFSGEFSIGMALNQYSPEWDAKATETVAGHMVDRINAIHRSAPCRQKDTNTSTSFKEPGWFYATHNTSIDGSANGRITRELEQRPLYLEHRMASSNVSLS